MRKNRDELLRFTPFTEEDVVLVDGTPAKRRRQLASGAKVFVMTAEGLKKHHEELGPDFQLLVADEWHAMYGGHGSQRTQALYRFMRDRRWLVAMTGTILNGRADTVYPWVHLVEPRYYGTYDGFMCIHGLYDLSGDLCGWKNLDRLAAIVGRHAIRRTFAQAYGPEAKVIQVEEVEMGPMQREAYDRIAKQALIELEQSFVDGTMPGVNVIRARQIMGHPEKVPTIDGCFADLVGKEITGKDERLLLHVDDHLTMGKPLVVFAALVPEQERIHRYLTGAGLRTGLINGSVSGVQRAAIDAAFRNGDLDAIVASPATAAFGFNWQHGGGREVEHVIFVSLDYMDTSFFQAYRRMIRGVRKTPLRITVLEYADSIDRRIFQIVRAKSELANEVDPSREVYELHST
jgi:hypothetical protein